eukprot:gene3687-biopygen21431
MRIPGIIKDNWDKGDYGLGQIAHFLLQGSVKKTGKGCSDYFIFEEDTCRWAKVDEGRVKSVVVEAMEEALRDVDLWIATQSAQRRLQGGDAKMRVANLDLKKREVVSLIRFAFAFTTNSTDCPAPSGNAGYQLWVDKYKPTNTRELVGNNTLIATLRMWLSNWEGVNLRGQQPQAPPGNRKNPKDLSKKAVLLSGPPGIGKTSAAHILAKG